MAHPPHPPVAGRTSARAVAGARTCCGVWQGGGGAGWHVLAVEGGDRGVATTRSVSASSCYDDEGATTMMMTTGATMTSLVTD